jgi:uncharacterized protein YndB with AHSA1/START domain
LPKYAADATLLAPVDDVWTFLAEPYNLGDWWPGISGVEPDRRGLAPGARWKIVGPNEPTWFRRPQATGVLQVLEVQPMSRIAFQLTGDRIDAELTLEPVDATHTKVTLLVDAPWLSGVGRAFPRKALARLRALLRTGEEPS